MIRKNSIELSIDCRCHTREAISATAYRLAGRYTVALYHDNETSWKIRLTPRGEASIAASSIEEEFQLALTNAQLQLDIQEKTADIRSLIVEHAFSPLRRRYQKKNLISRTTHFFLFISKKFRPQKSW